MAERFPEHKPGRSRTMSSKLMLSLAAAFALSAAASAPARADPMPSGEGREVTQSQHDDLGGRMTRWEMVAMVVTLSGGAGDRKSTRLNSSHGYISYAVFCLKKKKQTNY